MKAVVLRLVFQFPTNFCSPQLVEDYHDAGSSMCWQFYDSRTRARRETRSGIRRDPSYLDNEWVSSMDWAMTNAVGGVKLLVGSHNAESASEI